MPEKVESRDRWREQSQACRVQDENQRRQRPDRHQDNLAAEVVADLDLLLVLVRDLIDGVVRPGLKEEMTDLPAGHRYQPANQAGERGVAEDQRVDAQEA